jgi:hypothetical protein
MKILVIGVEDGLAISARTLATAAGVFVIKNGNLSAIDQPLGHRIIETPPMASFKQSKACLQQARSNLFRQTGQKSAFLAVQLPAPELLDVFFSW